MKMINLKKELGEIITLRDLAPESSFFSNVSCPRYRVIIAMSSFGTLFLFTRISSNSDIAFT